MTEEETPVPVEQPTKVDYQIPINVISKIIDNTFEGAYEEDLVRAISKCTSQFIKEIAKLANNRANTVKRKTIHAQDVLNSIVDMGYQDMGYDLIEYHSAYMDEKENQQKSSRKKRKTDQDEENEDDGDESQPTALSMDLTNAAPTNHQNGRVLNGQESTESIDDSENADEEDEERDEEEESQSD